MPKKVERCAHQEKCGVSNPFATCTSHASEECEKKMPFQEVYEGKHKEAASLSGMPQMGRADVNNLEIK